LGDGSANELKTSTSDWVWDVETFLQTNPTNIRSKQMKLTKIACVALSAALVFGTKTASAYTIVGTTTDYLKLSFNLTLGTQSPTKVVAGNDVWSYSNMKLSNKDILNELAYLAQTTWPAGAQLEYAFNGYYNESVVPKSSSIYQLIVADSTGTNILFFAGDGVDVEGMYGYFDFDPFDVDGVYSGHQSLENSQGIGSEAYTEFYGIDFEFYIEDYGYEYANYEDLYGGGTTTENYNESWTPKTDSGFDGINTTLFGGGYYQDQDYSYITGSVLGAEQWSNVTPRPAVAVRASRK